MIPVNLHKKSNLWNHNGGFLPRIVDWDDEENRLKAENILINIFLDHIVGRQSSDTSATSRLGSLFLVEVPHILIDYFNPEFTSKLINCENSTRNFQHIFITKKLCIHIEFSKFWLLEYLKSAKLHPRWSILNEKGKAFNIDHSGTFVLHWLLWRVSFCECMDRRGGG